MPFVLKYEFTPYTENQHRELSANPQLSALFEYLEQNRYQLCVGFCFFFFYLNYNDNLFTIVVSRSEKVSTVEIKAQYHQCNCCHCSLSGKDTQSYIFNMPANIDEIIRTIEQLK